MKCILIDDEQAGREVIKQLVSLYCPDVEIIGEAENCIQAYDLIIEHNPDFILLDIQMPGGSGFDLLKRFDNIDFDIIFVTSYAKYAINAIKLSALDYLLKPVEISELQEAIEKVRRRKLEKYQANPLILNLIYNLNETAVDKRMAIHHLDKVKFLNLSDVIYFEAESNYTNIYTIEKEKYTPARVLKHFEEFINSNTMFMRINKRIIINLSYVTEYSKGEPYILHLKNGKEFELSRRKKAELSERIKI